ncbi:MAG: hypothetical protein ACOYWZ_20170 [Bacillota bacterium]
MPDPETIGGSAAGGGLLAWFVHLLATKRRLDKLEDNSQTKEICEIKHGTLEKDLIEIKSDIKLLHSKFDTYLLANKIKRVEDDS